MKIKNNESGFIVSVIAIVVVVILGLFITYFSNSISLGITSSTNDYTNSQANWSAVSGIEYAITNMTNGQNNFAGIITVIFRDDAPYGIITMRVAAYCVEYGSDVFLDSFYAQVIGNESTQAYRIGRGVFFREQKAKDVVFSKCLHT